MKYSVLILFFIYVANLTHAVDTSETSLVDETKFSEVYPAVWFSPSTGEITALKKRSEVPPETKYEIWIEPNDSEFGYNPDHKPVGVGFVLIGKGRENFNNPKIPTDYKLSLKISNLMKESQAQEQLVFLCKAKTSTSLIMVTSMDSKAQLIQFKWRLLANDEEASLNDH